MTGAIMGCASGGCVKNVRRSRSKMLGAKKMSGATFFSLSNLIYPFNLFFIKQLPIIIAQVHDKRITTNHEVCMLTSALAVLQLMGSDEQFALPEFPVVLAYNRVNHYLPTVFLSNDSLLNWQLSTVNQLFEGAQTFFLEAQPQMHIKSPNYVLNLRVFLPKLQRSNTKCMIGSN